MSMMYPGGSKNFNEKTGKYRPGTGPVAKRPIRTKPFQPIARDTGGIIGRGGKMVDDIYKTY